MFPLSGNKQGVYDIENREGRRRRWGSGQTKKYGEKADENEDKGMFKRRSQTMGLFLQYKFPLFNLYFKDQTVSFYKVCMRSCVKRISHRFNF